MKRRFRCPVQAKKEFVTEVLSGMRTEVVARKYGMAPKTLRAWVRQYQDEVDELMVQKRDEAEQQKKDTARLQEMEEKYKDALKLLGEKELELHILRDLVKKKYPDWK